MAYRIICSRMIGEEYVDLKWIGIFEIDEISACQRAEVLLQGYTAEGWEEI